MPNVSSIYIPQDLNYPGIALNIDREKASLIGLSAKDVVQNVITAMTSDGMVAPSYWIDPKTGNNYMVTVQYANSFLNNMSMEDFENIPLRGIQPAGTHQCSKPTSESPKTSVALERPLLSDHQLPNLRTYNFPTAKSIAAVLSPLHHRFGVFYPDIVNRLKCWSWDRFMNSAKAAIASPCSCGGGSLPGRPPRSSCCEAGQGPILQ